MEKADEQGRAFVLLMSAGLWRLRTDSESLIVGAGIAGGISTLLVFIFGIAEIIAYPRKVT